jgi:hydrogenase nickel incorporation protein HypA/HybF
MHELGIMESAVDAALREACAHQASRIHRMVLRIGTLSGVEPDSLRFAFDVVTEGTAAAGAELEVESVPARAWCGACAREFGIESGFICVCPDCGALSGEIRQGREMELSRLEMS